MEQPLIAIVDDDESARDATERLMHSAGFSAETFSRGADFLSSPDLSRTACLGTDLNMSGRTGFDLHPRLQSFGQAFPPFCLPDSRTKMFEPRPSVSESFATCQNHFATMI